MLATLALLLAIQPQAIKAHVDVLAHNALEGREAGTRGYDVAAEYVAAQLEAMGVEPAGDDGTYLQQVRFRTAKLEPSRSSICIAVAGGDCVPLEHRKDVIINSGFEAERAVDAEVVLVGFGITAPELGHDDYAGIDVRGKIVAGISGAPPRFPHSQRAYYSDGLVKQALAASHGAVGYLNIRSLDSERRFPWARMTAQDDGTSFRALDASGAPMDVVPQIRGSAALGPSGIAALLRGARIDAEKLLADADQGVAHSFAIPARVSMRTVATIGASTSPNVVGIIRGSELPNEHVVLSAHLDHLGLTSRGEDRIRNGALDNASGIAALLEIARELAALPRKPRRSVVILALTAEEKGTQGSMAYVERDASPIVANVNMDMLTMLFPLKSLVALGIEHSSLAAEAREAARKAGFTVQDDPLPEEVRFIRSDQYSFVRKGIPAISYKGGLESRDPAVDGDRLTREWLRNVYHSVNDESDQPIHYESGARWAEANYHLVLAIADAPERPRWNDGDFFGKLFGRARMMKR